MKYTAPRISDATAKILAAEFKTINAGCEYILAAWPGLYRSTILKMKKELEPGGLKLMIDVFNGTKLAFAAPELTGRRLLVACADGIDLYCLDKKWDIRKVEFLDKIRALTIFEAASLEIWASGFWLRGNVDRNIEDYIK